MPKLKLVRGVSVNFLFSPTLFTLLDRAFPIRALADRAGRLRRGEAEG